VEPSEQPSVTSSERWWLLKWAAIITCVIVGCYVLKYVLTTTQRDAALQRLCEDGVVATATVTDRSQQLSSPGRQGALEYSYSFQVNGSSEYYSSISSPPVGRSLATRGDEFPVTYLPAHPATHIFGDVTQGQEILHPGSLQYAGSGFVSAAGVLTVLTTVFGGLMVVFLLYLAWHSKPNSTLSSAPS